MANNLGVVSQIECVEIPDAYLIIHKYYHGDVENEEAHCVVISTDFESSNADEAVRNFGSADGIMVPHDGIEDFLKLLNKHLPKGKL
mgnify:CR=1 FL=1